MATVNQVLRSHGVEALVLAEAVVAGKRVVLTLERHVAQVLFIDHDRADDAEDVRSLDAESVIPKVADWLKAQGVPDDQQVGILQGAYVKLGLEPPKPAAPAAPTK